MPCDKPLSRRQEAEHRIRHRLYTRVYAAPGVFKQVAHRCGHGATGYQLGALIADGIQQRRKLGDHCCVQTHGAPKALIRVAQCGVNQCHIAHSTRPLYFVLGLPMGTTSGQVKTLICCRKQCFIVTPAMV